MATNRSEIAKVPEVSAYERALLFGEVEGLSERERLEYLKQLSASVGLDPISRPFGYLPTGDKLTVYLTATGAAQLRRIHSISITEIVDEGIVNGFYRIKVYGKMPNGRVDVEYGSVAVTYFKTSSYHKQGELFSPQELENSRKKCTTQAKTRLTKSMVGLSGVLAEEEIEDIPEKDRGAPLVIEEAPRQLHAAPTPSPEDRQEALMIHDRLAKIREELHNETGKWNRLPDDDTPLAKLREIRPAWEAKIKAIQDAKAAEDAALPDVPGYPPESPEDSPL